MRTILSCLLFLCASCGLSPAEDTSSPVTIVGRIPWDGIYAARTQLPGGLLQMSLIGGGEPGSALTDVLRLDYQGTAAAQIPLVTLAGSPLKTGNGGDIRMASRREDKPGTGTVTGPYYLIMGQVKYENVAPGSYLEMWSHFGPGSYFSRTLAGTGMLESLGGSSDWRPFWLPFDSRGEKEHLTSLDLNLHLNGSGTVYLRDLGLGQCPSAIWLGADKAALYRAEVEQQRQERRALVTAHRSTELAVLIGVALAVFLAFVLLAGFIAWLLYRHNGNRRHERELRRIASLDG